jgi:predicted CXXCH cytochrome family protein
MRVGLLCMSVVRAIAWISIPVLLLMGLTGCGKGDSAKAAPAAAATQPAVPGTRVRVAPAPRPTAALAKDASCVTAECHGRFATDNHIHGPVASMACNACHEDDTGGHVYPLKRSGNQTCTFCHAVSGRREHQHSAILKQGCISCHNPHASGTKFLLVADSVQQLCARCHDIPLKKSAHRPFAAGECTVCHEPHESDSRSLLRGGTGNEHCLGCHGDMARNMATAAHVHKPATQDCLGCHGPHATDYAHQLKAPVTQTCLSCHQDVKQHAANVKVAHGAMLDSQGCANCHDAHASSQPKLLSHRMDQVCLGCHNKRVKGEDGRAIAEMASQLSAKNLHGPIRAGDCSACHEAHGGNQPDLLRKKFPQSFYASFDLANYSLCFSCHEERLVLAPATMALTNFRDGSRNLHFVHVNREDKGRTCKTCHAIHGSDLPRHMASSVPFEGSNWTMPIRYEATADGGRCAPGCHEPYAYSRSKATNPTTRPTVEVKQ